MTRDEQASEPHDPLRLDRCPDCGYLLTGLPADGRCPECGFAYTQDMIVVYVWPSGERPGTNRWWWVLGPILCLSVLQVWQSIWADPARLFFPRDFVSMLMLVGFLAPTIVVLGIVWLVIGHLWRRYRARRDNPPAPIQVRLTPQGYAVRYGFGRVKIKPWAAVHRLRLEPTPGGRCSLVIENSGVRVWEFTGGCQLDCDLRTADRIRQRVQTWCDQPASRRTQTESRPAGDPPGGSSKS